ncbi:DEAD/DEAH box helicase [Butyricicoccus sp.]|uniref:DEAD/DEAH box helicase n=1 Tax=Butyricicoccus sp. TaxID=2049021 RepID=UPI003F1851F3
MSKLRPYQEDILNNVRQAYRDGYQRPCVVLPCGGGKSCITAEIAKQATQKGNRVLFLVHRRELVDQIRQTFFDWGVDLSLCRVEMVQTACRRLTKMPEPRLIITDENHHCLAAGYRKIYDAYPHAQCLGVTATPVRLNGGGLGDVNDKLVVGVTAKWLIANHFLAPYDYFAPPVADLSGLHTKRGEFITAEVMSSLDKSTIYGDVVGYYKKLAAGRKAICYCASIRHSEEMAARFTAAGIPAEHIDGATDKYTRKHIIKQFRDGQIKILCNVDLISEGFDVPDCSCAILLRPTQSLTLYIQQSMRCMRYQSDKRAVIIDHVGNYTRFGMPDDDREWSLEPKKKKKSMVSRAEQVRQCPKCFFTFPMEQVCPHCGYEFPKKDRGDLEEDVGAELTKIEGFTLDYRTPDDCTTYLELLNYAKTHGYKSGWAYYQARNRGLLNDRA